MINEEALKSYLLSEFPHASHMEIRKLGEGVQGAGYLVEVHTKELIKSYVIKGLFTEGLGHDYPSDRASVFLLDLDEYRKLPKHIPAIDVLAEMPDGSVKSIGGGVEYYLLMEKANGKDYFNDLREFSTKKTLDYKDINKIKAMASYLANIHSFKRESKTLYWRKIRDTIGHGECLMGVFDTYPEGTLGFAEMAEIEKLCIDWRAKLKSKTHRLCQIHGDFHPGNIWFQEIDNQQCKDSDFILLDRSRGAWGDAADDITALTINYIFFSLIYYEEFRDVYVDALKLFFDEYIKLTNDYELFEVLALFYAFRCVVVANPLFYPDVKIETREKIFNFLRNILKQDKFNLNLINEYINERKF